MSENSFSLGMMFFGFGLIVALVLLVGGIMNNDFMSVIAGSVFGAIVIGNMISIVVAKNSK